MRILQIVVITIALIIGSISMVSGEQAVMALPPVYIFFKEVQQRTEEVKSWQPSNKNNVQDDLLGVQKPLNELTFWLDQTIRMLEEYKERLYPEDIQEISQSLTQISKDLFTFDQTVQKSKEELIQLNKKQEFVTMMEKYCRQFLQLSSLYEKHFLKEDLVKLQHPNEQIILSFDETIRLLNES